MHVLHHLPFVVVREAGTIPGTYGIDIAHIGSKIKELTGLFDIHPIPSLVFIQPFLPEGLIGHAQMSGDTRYIFLSVSGGHGLAAIGTVQTIRFCPGGLVGFGEDFVQALWLPGFQAGEEPFYPPLIITYNLSE